jgi:biopolymer transport protein ExbD
MATATEQGVYNVWIVGSNTVYRGVPFTVVCDWIQEGRLLPKDCVRTPSEQNWHYLNDMALFQPYFPSKDTTPRADDAAEAYAPIEMEFQTRHIESEDEDPDMIPLIDISMVLLVFFMMTSSALLADVSDVKLPEARTAYQAEKQGTLYIMVMYNQNKEHRYRVGAPAPKASDKEKETWKKGVLFEQLDEEIKRRKEQIKGEPRKGVITADSKMPFSIIQDLQVKLEHEVGLKVEFKIKFTPMQDSTGGGTP